VCVAGANAAVKQGLTHAIRSGSGWLGQSVEQSVNAEFAGRGRLSGVVGEDEE